MKANTLRLLIFLCLFSTAHSLAQSSLKLLYKIDTPAVYITADNLDNIYAVTARNQLLKYNVSGKLLWNYSNKSFGKLTYVDAADPMRILLFYPAIQQAVVLNNNLNEITRFNFSADASRQVTLIAAANSNGYWIFDQSNQQLQKLGNQFNGEQLSGNNYQQTGSAMQPALITASDQHVFLYDAKRGLMQFDRFGSFVKTIRMDTLSYIQAKENKILFLRDKNWISTDVSDNTLKTIYQFAEKPLQVSKGNKIAAVLTNGGFEVYLIEQNKDEKN